jgi:hypothetical protein
MEDYLSQENLQKLRLDSPSPQGLRIRIGKLGALGKLGPPLLVQGGWPGIEPVM